MKKLLKMAAAVLALASADYANAQQQPFPMEYWSVRNQISDVSISPNGKKLAFSKIESRDGNPIVQIRDIENLSGDPFNIGGKNMEITDYFWISDDDVVLAFRDQVSKRIKGFNQGAFKGKLAHFNLRNEKFEELTVEGNNSFKSISIENILPNDPDNVLVSVVEFKSGSSLRRPSYYKLNLKNGQKALVLKGTEKYGGIIFDANGNPRFAFSRDAGSKEVVYHYRQLGGGSWNEFYRRKDSDFDVFSPEAFVEGDPNRIYVEAHNGEDRTSIWKFNLATKSFEGKIHSDPVVDVSGVITHSNSWKHPGKVVGFSAYKDKFQRTFVDPEERNLQTKLEASIKNAGEVRITSRSRDGNVMVVRNVAPRDPGSYYLYDKGTGKFIKIGSSKGILRSEGLSDVEYITYKARDGETIPAFLTKPNASGPHPLVVMPHGGPFIREIVIYDEWAQMLANNGYMVLQPQYRGSEGYGLEFYKSGFINGGEGGKKMQDDKDDGVNHLVKKGLVDKNKVAFFGWSYGGYAALIAAARTPNLYQCSIAGAAVADNIQQLNYYRDRLDKDSRQGQEQLKFWLDSTSPIKEVSSVNIPLLVIHGSIDQRVPPKHAKKYVNELKDQKKDFKYIELKNADHFYNTLYYDHKMKMYPKIIEFLKNDCGM